MPTHSQDAGFWRGPFLFHLTCLYSLLTAFPQNHSTQQRVRKECERDFGTGDCAVPKWNGSKKNGSKLLSCCCGSSGWHLERRYRAFAQEAMGVVDGGEAQGHQGFVNDMLMFGRRGMQHFLRIIPRSNVFEHVAGTCTFFKESARA